MRKLLFLLPVAASALFLTGCDEVSYRERTVVAGGGPAYYGDDADFYYVSSRPYSRSYGQLYLRSGRYYYSRGGTYHVYNRPIHRRSHVRHVDYDRRDWDRGRDRDRDRRDYERVRDDRRDRDRDRDRDDDRRRNVQVRERNVYNVNLNRDGGQYRQVRTEGRSGLRTSQRQVEGTQRVRAEHAVQRQVKREGGERRRDRDRDGDRDRERRVD